MVIACLCICIFFPATAWAQSFDSGVIVGSKVAMRESPDTKAAIIARLGSGTPLTILQTNIDAEWHKIQYNGKTGYVSRMFVNLDSSLSTYKLTYTGTVINVKKFVNVRQTPKAKGKVLGTANKGAKLEVTKKNYISGWHQVKLNGSTGYIATKYLDVAPVVSDDYLTGLSIKGGNLFPTFTPYENGYVIMATSSKVTITAKANSGVLVDVNGTGKNSITLKMSKGSMKTVRISLNGTVRYTVYITKNLLTVGTWNIKRGYGNLELQGRLVYNQQPDIMGMQEVYQKKEAENTIDNLLSLRTKTMINTNFTKTIDYSGGAQYGIGTISRYKLTGIKTYPLDSGGGEKRVLQKAVLSISGKKVSFYNTHFSYNLETVRAKQFKQVYDIMNADKNKYKILTGDFNAKFNEFSIFNDKYNMVVTPDNQYYDFSGKPISHNYIDNFVITKNIKIANSRIIKCSLSDHYPVFAYLVLN
jgi:uncharacterized protein YgiM (DUF1202 family)